MIGSSIKYIRSLAPVPNLEGRVFYRYSTEEFLVIYHKTLYDAEHRGRHSQTEFGNEESR